MDNGAWDDPEGIEPGAPICGSCGVTMLPTDDGRFACANEDCDAYEAEDG